MTPNPLRVAIAGCGNIAGPYAKTMQAYPQVELVGATDVLPERAQALTAEYGGKAYATLDELLADPQVDLVVNLTIHHAHPAVITQCLAAGKHVHSEKPLAMRYDEAKALVDLAAARGLRLSCSPITYLGEAQQTAWKVIRAGELGTVRVVYCEVNWGRIESWHPNPGPFYAVGALFDVGVYPLTLVTTFLAPVRRVTAYGKVLHPDRVTKEGAPFHIDTPDFVVAALELADGTVVRLTTNFYVGGHGKQKGLEFHGDLGSLYLGSFQDFHAPVEMAAYGEAYAPVPLVRGAFQGVDWGRAVAEIADAIAEGRPQRSSGAQAAHVVEVCCAISESLASGRPVAVTSEFTPPWPLAWGE
jgi:predicted dehydrogenase